MKLDKSVIREAADSEVISTGSVALDGPDHETSSVLSHVSVPNKGTALLDAIGLKQQAAVAQKAEGGVPWNQLSEERWVEKAIDLYVSAGGAGRKQRANATWPCPKGWGIFTVEISVPENHNGRGYYSYNTYAEGQTFDLSSSQFQEQKLQVKANLEAAIKNQNASAVAQYQHEYQNLEAMEDHFRSSHNFLKVDVTANPSLFSRSQIRVVAKVLVFRLL